MWPHIGPISTYGIPSIAGIILQFFISYFVSKRLGIPRRVRVPISITYALANTVFAKALYDLHHGQFDLGAMFHLDHYLHGGYWGGLIVYFGLGALLARVLAPHKPEALDLVAVTVPIPWIFAKSECLFRGCCYGRPCALPWAITFPDGAAEAPPGVPLHPVQIYEMLLMVLILVVFLTLRYDRWRGTMLWWFLMLYGLGRAGLDVFRGDFARYRYLGPVTLTQMICIGVGLAAGGMLLFKVWRSAGRSSGVASEGDR
jgi:phosphatidylglycerol:prolipoprotein diacylglycerol transferase